MTTSPRVREPRRGRFGAMLGAAALALVAACFVAGRAEAQFGFGGQAVGGIAIDAAGIVSSLEPAALEALAAERRAAVAEMRGPAAAGGLRKISLRRIVAAVDRFAADGTPLPTDVLFLGGLERVTHVFVDPDGHDIILAGPADKATIGPGGAIVAAASGRPLLQLEDLIVALRAIDGARQGGMTCSIDPTPEGLKKLRGYLGGLKSIGQDPSVVFRGMETALGPRVVTVGGVPDDSRFARVLVAADYRMKRIGMGLEPSGVKGLPSYIDMVPPGARASTLPRFWLEADYQPLARDADELAWRIGDRRMRCLTENDALAKDGVERGAGGVDKTAQKWCTAMTEHYDELAKEQPVFADLVNCVDLAVVAALIRGRQLDARAGLDLGSLVDADALSLPGYDAPRQVPTIANGVKKGTTWVLSASGGVRFQAWQFASQADEDAAVAESRSVALAARPAADGDWWWD